MKKLTPARKVAMIIPEIARSKPVLELKIMVDIGATNSIAPRHAIKTQDASPGNRNVSGQRESDSRWFFRLDSNVAKCF